jgi:agmatinase
MPTDEFDPDAPASGDGLFGLPHTHETAAVVVTAVPFEATASYRRGTARGPEAILTASKQVDLYDLETGEPWRHGIALAPVDPAFTEWNDAASRDALTVLEAGGDPGDDPELLAACARVDAIMVQMNERVYEQVRRTFEAGKVPAVLGGDHSVPFGAIRAAVERHPGLGILHIDAHADLRVAYEGFTWSHASILYNVATKIPGVGPIVQVGIRDVGSAERKFSEDHPDLHTWYHPHVTWELAGGENWLRIAERMIRPLPKKVWVTFDIDGLDPSLCPNTGTPVPGGLSWGDALALLRALVESGRQIVGFDLNEVAPGADEWDAIVGARMLYKLAGWSLSSR